MGKIVVSEFVSVDGVMEGPGTDKAFDRDQWVFRFDRGDEGNKFKLDEVLDAELLLLGRTTYEGFAEAWPAITDEVGFAAKMNGMPKYVVSTTLQNPSWQNTQVITGDVVEAIQKLKQQTPGNILVAGSAQLVPTLAEHDLVDEYRLMQFPIFVGAGKRLFADTKSVATLRLTSAKPVGPDGVVILTYEPQRP
jgi:dihydrofolate reductase